MAELAAAQSNPDRLARTRGLKAAFEAVTVADLKAAAETYLSGQQPLRMRVVAQSK